MIQGDAGSDGKKNGVTTVYFWTNEPYRVPWVEVQKWDAMAQGEEDAFVSVRIAQETGLSVDNAVKLSHALTRAIAFANALEGEMRAWEKWHAE